MAQKMPEKYLLFRQRTEVETAQHFIETLPPICDLFYNSPIIV
jgi:hypothetical protein